MNGTLLKNESLAKHTSWRVGGPADRYYEPAGREDLASFVKSLPANEPILWLGLGSNLLVRDGGWRGTVIALHGALEDLRLEQKEELGPRDGAGHQSVYAEAGVHCARLAKFSVDQKLSGGGFFAGIPGTVGGALAMNAGAHGGETWNVTDSVEVMFRDGRTEWLPKSKFKYGYRHVQWPEGMVGFIAARFSFAPDEKGTAAKEMKDWIARRKATQPVGKPSAGSTFRNPPGDYAARLIEASGLKGHRIGGAEVSKLHANFILTDDTARAADVEALIEHVQRVVKDKQHVQLETEVKIVGERADA
jgi:UDP-N-acetylmuramate dehydrogenase